jgi:hypothetical protein
VYLRDRSELQHDHLYYLFFREKPDKTLNLPLSANTSPVARDPNNGFEEESKKMVCYLITEIHYNTYRMREVGINTIRITCLAFNIVGIAALGEPSHHTKG